MKIDVLDHGFVRLVSYMQPVPEKIQQWNPDGRGGGFVDNALGRQREHGWTGDLEIVRNARTSYDADWRTGDDAGKDGKLIHYLYRNHHTTPFEAMVFTFEVKAPIFVFRQWHRHRTWSYNEVSARYTELPEEYYIPEEAKIGVQSTTNKQRRTLVGEQEHSAEVATMMTQMHWAFRAYNELLKANVPRELARTVLPLSVYSRMFATVDLHNLLHFLQLRLHSHAQYEIRVYAEALLQLIRPICPIAVQAFEESIKL